MGTDTAPRPRWTVLRRRRPPAADAATRRRQAGQVLPIFAVMSVVLLGGAALITDVAWWWTNEQQMQRAADAAALAGAVYLPGNQSRAFAAAQAEAVKNGYTNGVDGVTITPSRDATNPRKLIVDIDGGVNTNFARVFCWQGGPCLNRVPISVVSAAEFVFPVPMGSPQNYYGVGLLRDAVTTTVQVPRTGATITRGPTAFISVPPDNDWSNPGGAFGSGSTGGDDNNDSQAWRGFDFSSLPASATITGIRLLLGDVELDGSGSACRLTAHLSWNGGTNWTGPVQSNQLSTSGDDEQLPPTGSSAWGRTWSRAEFVAAGGQPSPFQVRLTWNDGFSNCSSNRDVDVGDIDVQLTYDWTDTTTTTTIEDVDVVAPDTTVLTPQNFWGSLQSQGAPNIQGDAYMTYYDTRTVATNSAYNKDAYYQYGIEFPPGSSGGEVWVFDPGFCNVDSDKGTGEYYTFGSPNGSSSFNPVSTFYDLWNTHNTPFDFTDDIASGTVGSFGNDYRRLSLRDTRLSGSVSGTSPCDDMTWHHDWVRIGSGLSGGNTYRLHTHSTDPGNASDQRSTTALNNFAIWATASGGTPRVYGIGAMEAYVRLPGGRRSEFYLAQIDAEHAGKTMVINLWDPGDTGSLSASLEILAPFDDDYRAVPFRYAAERGSGNASDCTRYSSDSASSVTTNTGGSSRFNGCWLTMEIELDPEYSAPHPFTDTVTDEGGWWKIRYTMGGSAGSYSTDLTTWQVELRGNPVHLVPE
jgi:Flp pilus assembly protein TadG